MPENKKKDPPVMFLQDDEDPKSLDRREVLRRMGLIAAYSAPVVAMVLKAGDGNTVTITS